MFLTHFSVSHFNTSFTFFFFIFISFRLSQIKYLLVVILELNGVSEVQYKGVIMIDDGKYQ